MEAQRRLSFVCCCALLFVVPEYVVSQRYQSESTNFVVFSADPNLSRNTAELAEKYRKQLSMNWLGYEIENWSEKCPIYVTVDRHAGGETSFAFVNTRGGRGTPIDWQMKIYGPVDRLLDAVLPHEITHTVFATHFGRPLPRWADEGACTTVEHVSERQKNHQMLISFLSSRPSRGIPFNRMFTMKQYPHDILPLYAQGYSVARFLIAQKGRIHFVEFLEHGMNGERSAFDTAVWDQATEKFYGYNDLSELQVSWERWVRSGSPELPNFDMENQLAQNASRNFIDPNSTYSTVADSKTVAISTRTADSGSWYARESRSKQAVAVESDGDSDVLFLPGSTKNGRRKSVENIWR